MSRMLGLLNPRPYEGQSKELIIGIDVGTTFSGVCYSFLRPGQLPEVYSVMRFEDQAQKHSKVPSKMYYDKDSILRAAGATATLQSVKNEAECEGWLKVELFKMHMRPQGMALNTNGLTLDDLPKSKTITEVMGDFLRYMYQQTRSYIEERHGDGGVLLEEVSDRTSFVLSLPNGWTGLPQQRMREAAIIGGLIEDSLAGRDKIKFVSEGEASTLSCLASDLCPSDLKNLCPHVQPGYRFMIADAGGGTLDMTSYEVTQSKPLRLKELTSSDCRFAGSVFVNMEARRLLQKKLRGTHYDNPEMLDDIVEEDFEINTKKTFANISMASWLRIDNRKTLDAKHNIRNGRLRLDGPELARCFQFSVDQALQSIRGQMDKCDRRAMPIWLVGGFAESPWLFRKLKEELQRDGIVVSRPDITLSSAVAHGNVLYSFEHTVTSRVTRCTYGIVCGTPYIPSDPDHYRRRQSVYESLNGDVLLPGKFDVIVHKNIEVGEDEAFTQPYQRHIDDPQNARCEIRILGCIDENSVPDWHIENEDKFHHICTVNTDLTSLRHKSRRQRRNGKRFWTLQYNVEISFGPTELQARVKWIEAGETKYGPATIFYEE